jgi:EAL domain-containing protein (putative c-di-GMP-specific phosphodiesterase class I)/HAMP domain-containing protein
MFSSLRVKLAVGTLALLVLGTFAAAWYARDRLAERYDQLSSAQLESVGRTLALDLDPVDLARPAVLRERLRRVRLANPELLSLSVYRLEGSRRTLVASSHPAGTSAATLAERRRPRAVALTGYGRPLPERERRGVPIRNRGARTKSLTISLPGRFGVPIGELRLVLDRTASDTALARDVGRMIVLAALVALLIGLSFATLLNRSLLAPLAQLREAIHSLRVGASQTRLGWSRGDELGELSGDFDAMAEQLEESHSRLQSLALKDPLTGLLNHRSFHEALMKELGEADAAGAPLALVVLDLDHFKAINDNHGHSYGDRLTCSAGVASFPRDARDATSLFNLADGALYWAKRSGRDRTRLFDPEYVTAAAPDDERKEITALLEQPERLSTLYQPWVELATGRLAGFEALTRFESPVQRPPDEWFGRAHRCGLGEQLEALAIRRALETPGRPEGTFLSINMSPSVLTSPVVHEVLPESLTRVIIEVTEQEAIVDLPDVERALDGFRRRGARVALDDAGVGYAGLQELMRLRPDIIKLDRSLICDLPHDPAKVALAESLVRFAHRTGATVCGEGIETLDELVVLADLDMTYGQGYALARPAPAWPEADAAMLEVLRRRSARTDLDPMDDIGSTEAGDRRLEHICARISECRTVEELSSVLAIVATELDAEDVCVSRWNRAQRQVDTLALSPGCPDPGGGVYELDDYPTTERVLLHGEAAQLLQSDQAEVETHFLEQSGHGSLLMVPVAFGGETIGLLEVMRRLERAFTRTQQNRARIIALQLGGTLAGGRLASAPQAPTLRYRGSQRLAEA